MRARLALACVAALAVGDRAAAEEPTDPMDARDSEKRPAGRAAKTNRLAAERSPYLRQHATNPVDWMPWGPEALARAQREGKPVFLSIGYAACHWCHVMEHESFEDERTAAAMNDAFVCVKVDREERPDLDDAYMTATQLTTGRGGWPMTCFLLPDGRPFFAGTYYPREHLLRLVAQAKDLWARDRSRVEAQAEEIAGLVRRHAAGPDAPPRGAGGSDEDLVRAAVAAAADAFDRERGGFDRVPKFPPHAHLDFLLDRGGARAGAAGLAMATKTLDGMASGGMRDHVGGGFHRYSTDAEWLVPHFEKMLYDNALLARSYARAFAVTRDERYADVARETLGWVVREMSVAGGGYASSLDADTEGEEGLTYTWTVAELHAVLGPRDGAWAARVFGARDAGNYREEATRRATGRNILHRPVALPDVARAEGRDLAAVRADLARVKAALLAARARRAQPGLDDKVITSWNGLLLSAFAEAGRSLRDPAWTARAEALAAYLLSASRDEAGRLLRFPKGSGPAIPGFLDDHAHLADGLLDLAEVTGKPAWRRAAQDLAEEVLARFTDAGGGFFQTSTDHEALLVRPKDAFDTPIPSANATAARVLLRLSVATGLPTYRDACDRTLAAFRPLVERAPTGTMALLRAIADRADAKAPGVEPARGDVHVRRGPAEIDVFLERSEARPGTAVRVLVRLTFDAGWHVTPHEGGTNVNDTLVESVARAPATLVDVVYPGGTLLIDGQYSGGAYVVYQGTVRITGALSIPADAPPGPRKIGLAVRFQPCDATSCKATEEVRLDVPLRFADADGPPKHPELFR
jgi:uncharacterized protein YyaL (SSP411 family)